MIVSIMSYFTFMSSGVQWFAEMQASATVMHLCHVSQPKTSEPETALKEWVVSTQYCIESLFENDVLQLPSQGLPLPLAPRDIAIFSPLVARKPKPVLPYRLPVRH